MKHIFSFAFFFGCLLGLQAQTIRGTVLQADGKPAEFATVLLFALPDSLFVKGGVTDSAGYYALERIPAGRYRLLASVVGGGTASSAAFDSGAAGDTPVPTLLLGGENALREVTVRGQRPVIEAKGGRLVFNVENSLSAVGLNGLELLRRAPGVNLDQDNNLSIKGKTNVQVYIDGRRSPLGGADLAAFLQGLNANDVEAIEVIGNPGAQFDAEGNAGVINIRLKKSKIVGLNGSASGSFVQGITPKGDGAFNVNYRNGRANLFGSASYADGIWHGGMDLNSQVGDSLYAQSAPNWRRARNLNLRLGTDWYLNSRHTLGVLLTGGNSEGESANTTVNNLILRSRDSLLRVLRASREGDFARQNLNSNLNYRFADTLGHVLNVDADWGIFRNDGNDYMPNTWRNATEETILEQNIYRSETPSNIDIRTLKADYEQRLGKKGKFSAGFKVSDVETDNTFNFFNVRNGDATLDTDRSNAFFYREKIQAGYAIVEQRRGKWTMQAGLRGENTRAKGDLVAFKPTNARNVDTAYFQLFPSASLSFGPNWRHSFSLSYRRSLDRPNYRDLNPFEFKLDEVNFSRGNPFLFPQTTHSLEFNYTLRQQYAFSLSVARTRDFFSNLTDRELDAVTGREAFFLTKRNFGARQQYNASLSAPLNFTKWWSGYANVYVNHEILDGDFGGERVVALGVTNVGLWAQQNFRLGGGWSLECSGWFSSGGLWGAYVNQPQGIMDMGLQKKLWKGKGSLKATFGDVLGTVGWRAETELGRLRSYGSGWWEARTLRLNLSYRFGNQKIAKTRDRKTGLDEEQKRSAE